MGKQERSLASGGLFPDFKSSQNCSPPHGSIFALTDSAELRPGILRRKVARIIDQAAGGNQIHRVKRAKALH